MKKRNEIALFAAFLTLAVLVSLVYVVSRERAIGRMRAETQEISRRRPAVNADAAPDERLVRMFPDRPDFAPFVDGLYQYAQKAGVKNLEVQTLKSGERGRAARSGKAAQAEKTGRAAQMRADTIKITMEGRYRNIAEYIRLVQNSERFVRIVELELRTEKDLLKAGMTVEIFSVGGRDAS